MTLDQYLSDKYPDMARSNQNEVFGLRIRASRVFIDRLRAYRRTPSIRMAHRIYVATDSLVTAEDLISPAGKAAERELVISNAVALRSFKNIERAGACR